MIVVRVGSRVFLVWDENPGSPSAQYHALEIAYYMLKTRTDAHVNLVAKDENPCDAVARGEPEIGWIRWRASAGFVGCPRNFVELILLSLDILRGRSDRGCLAPGPKRFAERLRSTWVSETT